MLCVTLDAVGSLHRTFRPLELFPEKDPKGGTLRCAFPVASLSLSFRCPPFPHPGGFGFSVAETEPTVLLQWLFWTYSKRREGF